MMTFWKNITLFEITLAQILKKNLIANLFTIKSFCDEATDFRVKETPKVGSDCTSLVVITIDSAFKKDKNYYLQVLSKRM